ncbi:MAG TPA: MFS transporter [Sphingomonas sp.]|nr:MFS transporter [Sphingomonas sp.]
MTAIMPGTASDLINARPLSRVQLLIIALCFLMVAVDGFDTAVIGFVAPRIAAEWQLHPEMLAALFGSALLGSIVGSAIFGPVCDIVGRTRTLIVATFMFGALTLVAGFATSFGQLVGLRFLAGIGLGGVLPCAIALTSEFAPDRRRSSLVNAMFCGYTLGAASSGFVAAWLMPLYGWQKIFVIGGCVPMVIAVIGYFVLPESLNFLATKGNRQAEISRTVQRIAPGAIALDWVPLPERTAQGTPATELFAARPVAGTLLLWLTAFCGLMSIYLLNSWMPTLLTQQGYSISEASIIGAMFQVGGTLGAILLGIVMDRGKANRVLAAASLLAGLFLLIVALVARQPIVLGLILLCAGICIPGAQVGASAYAASWYPTRVRATGISWMSGMGRIGSLLGSVGGGVLVSLGLGVGGILALLAIPMSVAGLAMAVHERVRVDR